MFLSVLEASLQDYPQKQCHPILFLTTGDHWMSPRVRDGCCPRRCQELAAAGRQEKPGAARRQEQEGNNGYKEAGAARRQKQK